VPIPAVAVRELVFDDEGQIVKAPRERRQRRTGVEPVAVAAELAPGQTREEVEGVFVLRNDAAEFVPIKLGIAGDRYFEVLQGLRPGDRVITGPYNSVRGMGDGEPVKVEEPRDR
jgi:HlyD family secretion protein